MGSLRRALGAGVLVNCVGKRRGNIFLSACTFLSMAPVTATVVAAESEVAPVIENGKLPESGNVALTG